MDISQILKKECVFPDLRSTTKKQVIKELSENISSEIENLNAEKINEILTEREKLCSTALDSGIAIPHGKLSEISKIIMGIGISKKGIDFESLDGEKTHIFILLIAPHNASKPHIEVLARISKIFKNKRLREKILNSETKEEIYNLVIDENEKL